VSLAISSNIIAIAHHANTATMNTGCCTIMLNLRPCSWRICGGNGGISITPSNSSVRFAPEQSPINPSAKSGR